MKKLAVLVAILTIVGAAYAAIAPFGPDEEKIINQFKVERTLAVPYDIAVLGGTSGATYSLGKQLPAGAVITQSWVYVNTVVSGTGTIAFTCEDAGNIKAAAQYNTASAGSLIAGASTGAASAFGSGIADTCEVSATVASSAVANGKLTAFIRYIVP